MRHSIPSAIHRAKPARLASLLASVTLAACAMQPPPATAPLPVAATAALSAPTFPPIPTVNGKLDLRVVYPPDGATIAARDSTFLFGSTGSGDARLTINGHQVPVLPNGAWLAWLPLPPREQPQWNLVAARGGDTVKVTRRLAFPTPRKPIPATGPLTVDTSSLRPTAREARLSTDLVRVSLRTSAFSAVKWLAPDGTQRPLRQPPNGTDSTLWSTDIEARLLAQPGRIEVTGGADTIRLVTPRVTLLDSAGPRYAILGERSKPPAATEPDSDRVVIGKPTPSGGTYKWFFLPGTVAEVTGRSGEQVRLRLDRDLSVWVDAAEVRELPLGTAAPVRVAGNARVVSRSPEVSDLVIPMAERPPYIVHEGTESLTLELFGTTANTDIINLASADSLVRRVTWEAVGEGRARFVITLREPPYGYLVRWERGALVLRLRRAPRIANPNRPLQGLTIAVDAGHPPAGSTGPTGLYEAVATLEIAQRLKPLLESRGATVLMTRTTSTALGLSDRPELARRANAHAFVSIHLNALPDGVNPFTAHGTGTYYFNPRAEPLAREVQRAMVRHMGLRDLGINYDNLAVLRPTWMPAILCEGAFVMFPEQEALLRTPEFQHAYALGVAEGVEHFFAGLRKP
ncbi:MAG: N-acetylmuramoyl-L-alanine amidase [Gemmatimonadaceae bacterium]|nr:N-acetylmuramoyl-L-alanine amidase [Gemmatimonadaceae bacterium]